MFGCVRYLFQFVGASLTGMYGQTMWNLPEIQQCYAKRSELQLPSSADYIMVLASARLVRCLLSVAMAHWCRRTTLTAMRRPTLSPTLRMCCAAARARLVFMRLNLILR